MKFLLLLLLSTVLSSSEPKEKAVVLWQQARQELLQGEKESSKEAKRAHFSKGVELASKSIEADPKNPDCYMWHSANVGRLCQTQSLPEQAKAVPVMVGDLKMILETLGRTNYFEAWQALAEIYYHHPFKSNDTAINYTRKALSDYPDSYKDNYIYNFLADALYSRNWSAAKRAEEQKRNAIEFKKQYKSVIDKYAFYDGVASCTKWSSRKIGEMSDREEAEAIRGYIKTR